MTVGGIVDGEFIEIILNFIEHSSICNEINSSKKKVMIGYVVNNLQHNCDMHAVKVVMKNIL